MRHNGCRFYFYSHEPKEPRHVHVDQGDATAKIWLMPVSIAHDMGFSAKELDKLLCLFRTHQTPWLEAWHGYFAS